MESHHAHDPFLVHSSNVVLLTQTDAHTFIMRDELRVRVCEDGVVSLREGSVKLQKLFFSLNVDIRSEHCVARVETDIQQRAVLHVDDEGAPLIVDGHYVPRRYDDWLVLTVSGLLEAWKGIPTLTATNH